MGADAVTSVHARSEDSKSFRKVVFEFGGYKIRYAWVSQCGYYPEDPNKANQDAHVELENFASSEGLKDMTLFGVFDGHGKTGDTCAHFARDLLPTTLARELGNMAEKGALLDIASAYRTAFVEVNSKLHERADCDDSMSGTTASTR